jgi:hypothetical protein
VCVCGGKAVVSAELEPLLMGGFALRAVRVEGGGTGVGWRVGGLSFQRLATSPVPAVGAVTKPAQRAQGCWRLWPCVLLAVQCPSVAVVGGAADGVPTSTPGPRVPVSK